MNLAWFNPPIGDSYPLVTTTYIASDGYPSIKVHGNEESLRLMAAEIEELEERISMLEHLLGCEINEYSSGLCEFGTKSCEAYHD